MSDEKKIDNSIAIDASAADVWRAVSEGEELKRWFPLDARVTPGVGGEVWLSWGEGAEWGSPIELWEPNRHLRVADAAMRIAVDYLIEAGEGGTTVMRIVQTGFGADVWDDEVGESTDKGWKAFLANLKHYLERHRGEPRTMARYRHPVVELPREEAYRRMLGALGVRASGVGERFDATASNGDRFVGTASVVAPGVNFSGALENWGEGFLMIEIEPGRGRCRPAVWVSLYGDAGSDAAALENRLQTMIDAAFA